MTFTFLLTLTFTLTFFIDLDLDLDLAGQLVRAVTGIVEAAVQYELLRTKTPEAQASDHQFLNILTMARESAGLRQMQKASGQFLSSDIHILYRKA